MARRLVIALSVCLAIGLAWSAGVAAQDKAKAPPKEKAKASDEQRVEGTVQAIDKATKTIQVRMRGKTASRPVTYTDATKFTFRNKTSTLDEVKDGRRVICLGKPDGKNWVASRVDVRDQQ
jgi:hypothetical protein